MLSSFTFACLQNLSVLGPVVSEIPMYGVTWARAVRVTTLADSRAQHYIEVAHTKFGAASLLRCEDMMANISLPLPSSIENQWRHFFRKPNDVIVLICFDAFCHLNCLPQSMLTRARLGYSAEHGRLGGGAYSAPPPCLSPELSVRSGKFKRQSKGLVETNLKRVLNVKFEVKVKVKIEVKGQNWTFCIVEDTGPAKHAIGFICSETTMIE